MDRVPFVQQSLIVNLFQQPPNSFDVAIIVSNVRVVHIYPVAHAAGQLFPFAGVFHHLLAAGGIVLFNTDCFPDIFFGNSQRFLNA